MEKNAKESLFELSVFINELNDKEVVDDENLKKYLSYLAEDLDDFSAARIRDNFVEKAGWLVFSKIKDVNQAFDAVNTIYASSPKTNSQNTNNLIILALIRYFKESFKSNSKTKPQALPKLILNLVYEFKEDSTDTYKVINRLLFMKLMFKHLRKFQQDDDLNLFLSHSVNYLQSLASEEILVKHLSSKYSAIYLLNKYLRCISALWLNTENKEVLLCFDNRESFLKVYLDFFLNEFDKIENLGDKTLVYRVLMNIMSILIEFKNDYSESENNLKKLHHAFYSKSEMVDFKLSEIYVMQQDDDLIIDFNLLCLNITLKKAYENFKFLRNIFETELNSHLLFMRMLDLFIEFKYETVIEWLITNETDFLLYFLRYVKYLWSDLDLNQLENVNRALSAINAQRPIIKQVTLDMVFNFLQEISTKLGSLKKSFPYNCEPLIKAIDKALTKLISIK
jgi:hypothetical protein